MHRIVNQEENEKILKSLPISASKYPPVFGFDLHEDDLEGVGFEAERLKFMAIIINPSDKFWIKTVKREIKRTG